MIIRVIDLETTGFAPPAASIIEIAFIDLDEHLQEVGRFQSFVLPPKGVGELLNAPGARAVHHIRPEDIEAAPLLGEVVKNIEREYGKPDVLIAHNTRFERQWLAEIWPQAAWICTMKTSMATWKNAEKFSLSFLRYWLELNVALEDQPAHRAFADVLVATALIRRLSEHHNIGRQIEIEARPAELPVMPFGRHRGSRWEDMPTSYLVWIELALSVDPEKEDVVFAASQELEKRRQAA